MKTFKKSSIYFDEFPKSGSQNAVTSDGVFRAMAQVAGGGGGGGGDGETRELLWKNETEGLSIGEETITVPDLSAYKKIEVEFLSHISLKNACVSRFVLNAGLPSATNGFVIMSALISSDSLDNVSRFVSIANDTAISFTNGYRTIVTADSNTFDISDSVCVPTAIYGIK